MGAPPMGSVMMGCERGLIDNWRQGPLPPHTWNWGGVVLQGQAHRSFYFADFWGDHVIIYPSGKRVEADEVVMYNNSLVQPPDLDNLNLSAETSSD